MTPLGLVGAAAQVGLAAIFLAAALPKALGLASLRRTLERLGLGEQLAGVAAPALVAVEAITATSLLVRPGAAWPRALAALLALAFAAAGVMALARKEPIACNCFGSAGRSGRLGWRQVRALAAWLPLIAAAHARPPAWDAGTGLLVLAALALAPSGVALARELPLWWRLRGDRIAIRPSQAGPETGVVEAG